MGRGMGFGGAQLGKAVKGKSKERKKDKKLKLKENITEKQLSEDIKMLEEYEKMNKLAEAQRNRLKKLQQQEAYNTRLNKKLLLQLSRQLMRAEKVQSLRSEMEILAQNQERDVERKDAIIHMLVKDLEDAEEQFQTAQRSHMDRMHRFLQLHTSKVEALEGEFERDLKVLKLEFGNERSSLISQHILEMKEMKNVIHAVDHEESERINEAKQLHETEREEIRNKNLESINELRINLENKIEDLERQFDEAHTAYVENTSTANENFKKLKQEDANLSLHIFEKKKKIIRLQNNLISWRKKLEYNQKECSLRNNLLREQKEAINKHCNLLKLKMKRFRSNEAKHLTELTVLSRTALQANQLALGQAERILMLAELSRKFETEREKVLPFYESTHPSSHTIAATANNNNQNNTTIKIKENESKEANSTNPDLSSSLTRSDDDSEYLSFQHAIANGYIPTAYNNEGKPIEEWSQLDNFYKKYNKVLLDKLAVQQEKKRLQKVSMCHSLITSALTLSFHSYIILRHHYYIYIVLYRRMEIYDLYSNSI